MCPGPGEAGGDDPSPQRPAPVRRPAPPLLSPLLAGARRIASTPHLRGEIGWVIGHKVIELGFLFGLLKLLTTRLGKEGYGEYNLADTALMLVATVLVVPMNEAYLRDYHGAAARGEQRSAGVTILRWYAISTLGTAAALALASPSFAAWFGIGTWTALAAGLLFLGERWRSLGHEWLNIRRQRRAGALWNLGFLSVQISVVAAALALGPATASTALLANACASLLFAALVAGPIALDLLRLPAGGRSRIPGLVLSFGVPFAALQLFQWTQAFSDRYMVAGLLDPASVGLYVAAFQVCGVPFVLTQRITHELLTPIVYQRSQDVSDPAQLWSADRLILAGLGAQIAIGIAMVACYLLLGSRLLVLLTNEDYVLPSATIGILAAARFAQAVAGSLQSIFAVHRRMGVLLWFRSFGALLTPAVCWITIPVWGVSGAAIGILLSFAAYLLLVVSAPGGCLWLVTAARRAARAQALEGADPSRVS